MSSHDYWTEQLEFAQRVLERSDGDLAKAITKAAFRGQMVKAINGSWPKLIDSYAKSNAEVAGE